MFVTWIFKLAIDILEWCVIKKIVDDEEEFDCVPTTWLISPRMMSYPDKGAATAKKLAKNRANPENDWLRVPITIVKEHYEMFDRGMIDAVRFQKGARSISASETEERGAGRRNVRSKKRSSSEDSVDMAYPLPPKKAKRSPKKSPKVQEAAKRLSHSSTYTIQPTAPSTSTAAAPEAAPTCEISKKSHFCIFQKEKPMTLESLAIGVCQLSKSVQQLHNKIKEIRLEIGSRVIEKEQNDPNEQIEEEHLFALPIKSMHELRDFEERLKEKQFFANIMKVLSDNIEKTNVSKTARSAFKRLMDTSLTHKFSWKGQQRKDQVESKECFSKLLTCELIYKCVRSVWPNENDVRRKIESTLSTFLAQQGSLSLRRSDVTINIETTDELEDKPDPIA